jgi:hypothetical protein
MYYNSDSISVMAKKVEVTALLPRTLDVSIRGASTALRIDVQIDGEKRGSLNIGSGSVAWWPSYSSVNGHRATWEQFIEMMETRPTYRIAKRLGRWDCRSAAALESPRQEARSKGLPLRQSSSFQSL